MALRRVFTYLGAIFLMSHIILYNNVHALDITEEVTIHEVYKNPYWSDSNTPSTFVQGGRTYSNNANYAGTTYIMLKSSSNNPIGAAAGSYFVVNGTVIAYSDDPGYLNQSTFLGLSTASVDCPIIDFDVDEVSSDLNSATQHRSTRYTFTATCRLSSDISQGPTINLYLATATPQSGATQYLLQMNAMVRATPDISGQNINTKLSTISNYLQNIYSNNEDILEAIRSMQNNQQNEIDETNAAVEGSQDAGDSSSSDAQTGTASLISTIGSAVSAITSASPTNCLLNGDMGNFDMGQIDLCANPVPAFVQIIGSLILILVTVPLCIVLFNRFIGLFRSFQG